MSEKLRSTNSPLSPNTKELLKYFKDHNHDHLLHLVNLLIDTREIDSKKVDNEKTQSIEINVTPEVQKILLHIAAYFSQNIAEMNEMLVTPSKDIYKHMARNKGKISLDFAAKKTSKNGFYKYLAPDTEKRDKGLRSELATLYDNGIFTVDRLQVALEKTKQETVNELSTLTAWRRLNSADQQLLQTEIFATPSLFLQVRQILRSLDTTWNLADVHKLLSLNELTFELRTALLLVAPKHPSHLLVTLETIGVDRLRNSTAYDRYVTPEVISKHTAIEKEEFVLSSDKTLYKIREFSCLVNPTLDKYWSQIEQELEQKEKQELPFFEYKFEKNPKGVDYIMYLTGRNLAPGDYTMTIDAKSWLEDESDEEKPRIVPFVSQTSSVTLFISLRNDANANQFPHGTLSIKIEKDGTSFKRIMYAQSPYTTNGYRATLGQVSAKQTEEAKRVPKFPTSSSQADMRATTEAQSVEDVTATAVGSD